MTLVEKLRMFQIGNLSHATSAAIVVGAMGGAAAAAVAVPLTVGQDPGPYVP